MTQPARTFRTVGKNAVLWVEAEPLAELLERVLDALGGLDDPVEPDCEALLKAIDRAKLDSNT